jgi:hypothetical protein
MNSLNKKQFIFSIFFTLLGLAAMQVPLTHLVGSQARFTLFDSFAPIAGGFLGSFPGAISVLLMQFFNFLIHGAKVLDAGTIIRFLPMMFATIYFGKRTKINLFIPIIAIIVFNLNPIGRSVWYFSLYWLIPVVCYFFQERFLFAKSLGATFTAHSVGGALWIYFFHLPKLAWIALIPVVAIERFSFAVGISVSYLVFNNVLNYINNKKWVAFQFPVNPSYVWKFN